MGRPVKFARQGTTKVHVVPEEPMHADTARCGADVAGGDEYPARLVPDGDRCRAPGCRSAWPADLRLVG